MKSDLFDEKTELIFENFEKKLYGKRGLYYGSITSRVKFNHLTCIASMYLNEDHPWSGKTLVSISVHDSRLDQAKISIFDYKLANVHIDLKGSGKGKSISADGKYIVEIKVIKQGFAIKVTIEPITLPSGLNIIHWAKERRKELYKLTERQERDKESQYWYKILPIFNLIVNIPESKGKKL